jgi:hypothetical protein
MRTEFGVLVILAVMVAIANIVQATENNKEPDSEINDEFNRYAKKFGKNYNSRKTKSLRIALFKKARAEVMNHNEQFANGEQTYKKELNELSDMTDGEKDRLLGAVPP